MTAPSPSAEPRPLRPIATGGLLSRLRALWGRGEPRAEVVAAPEVRLGEELTVTWRLDHASVEVTNVSVTLVGREIARERISARTGISVVTNARPFLTLAVDRRMPEAKASGSEGRGSVLVPRSSAPTVAGHLNEISWAIVIEAAYQADAVWAGTFPVTVLPLAVAR
jgi:hypothetical protein